MGTFSIQHGPTPLRTWDLDSGQVSTHDRAVSRDGMLVLPEGQPIGFVLEPAESDLDYRIWIGDVPLADIAPTIEDAAGIVIGGRVYWRDLPYFESARAHTEFIVESRPRLDEEIPWHVVLSSLIYILPSKLGEDRYAAMTADLGSISQSLLSDLYGKSRRTVDLRYAARGRADPTREAELRSIEETLVRAESVIRKIAQRPASRVVSASRVQQYWGAQHLDPTMIASLARRGIDLRTSPRPVQVRAKVRAESFDVAEHRIAQAFLELLSRRCAICADTAKAHARAIADERHLRDVRIGVGPSIFESVDIPRLAKLQSAVARARRCGAMARAIQQLPFLRDVPAEFCHVKGGVFQRNAEYRMLSLLIRRFLLENAQWYEGNDYASVTKLTWRIFEQWTFLRIVDAFRNAGIELREWSDTLRQHLRSRFLIDFDRGLNFEGALGQDLRLRFRYEPWILSRSAAIDADETLYRGRRGEVAWCPDIVIECMQKSDTGWFSVYAVVLDCKYTTRVTNQHWGTISKYLEIRSSGSDKQVAKQLWLVSPSDTTTIRSEDPAIDFSNLGPTCDENEAVRFRLNVTSDALESDTGSISGELGFGLFAEGTLAFLRRVFSRDGIRS